MNGNKKNLSRILRGVVLYPHSPFHPTLNHINKKPAPLKDSLNIGEILGISLVRDIKMTPIWSVYCREDTLPWARISGHNHLILFENKEGITGGFYEVCRATGSTVDTCPTDTQPTVCRFTYREMQEIRKLKWPYRVDEKRTCKGMSHANAVSWFRVAYFYLGEGETEIIWV